ncbi:hypothetical protein D8B26_002996 [Coccidioides posadasii str. Silveira]|uniref:Uncharacterized protein n=1 Tax=Coccidioides posadasii (strain RMSCC 757 / Silveira) TaxID=443226 RepID=E9CXJ2_COCPS|nr:conserved hypothetical protein [Coccidioides posadasii str. Silveira]QVM08304.1 hypothetical protein D8B26_002996 [Coccidioides posadasii str. Silveira]
MFSTEPSGLEALLHRPRPTRWQHFASNPIIYISQLIYNLRPIPKSNTASTITTGSFNSPVTVVCISDTHNCQPHIPDGDILIHAGDLTQSGSREELQEAISWLNRLPHKYKIVIAGNHDISLDPATYTLKEHDLVQLSRELVWGDVIYLQSSSVKLTFFGENKREISVYGSPFSPRHGNWAFQYPRRGDFWLESIPEGTDVLATHAPPRGHLDLGYGCESLLRELWRLRCRPGLHVFGHVHEGYGVEVGVFDGLQKVYEGVVMGRGNRVWGLIKMLGEFVKVWVRMGWRRENVRRTSFVNASIVGGLLDEESREPVIVTI